MNYLGLILCTCGLVSASNTLYKLLENGDINKTAKELEKCLPDMSHEDVAKFSVVADSHGMLNSFMSILKYRVSNEPEITASLRKMDSSRAEMLSDKFTCLNEEVMFEYNCLRAQNTGALFLDMFNNHVFTETLLCYLDSRGIKNLLQSAKVFTPIRLANHWRIIDPFQVYVILNERHQQSIKEAIQDPLGRAKTYLNKLLRKAYQDGDRLLVRAITSTDPTIYFHAYSRGVRSLKRNAVLIDAIIESPGFQSYREYLYFNVGLPSTGDSEDWLMFWLSVVSRRLFAFLKKHNDPQLHAAYDKIVQEYPNPYETSY